MAAIPFLCGNTGDLVNGTGSGSVTCFLDAGPGNILTTITLDRSADAKNVMTGAPVVSFDWLAPSGIAATAGAITFTLTVPETGGAFTASPPSPFSVTFAGPGTQTASFFDSFSSSVTGGTLMSSFGTLGGSFSASAVPEPSIGALLSAGLLGLAMLGGRLRRCAGTSRA